MNLQLLNFGPTEKQTFCGHWHLDDDCTSEKDNDANTTETLSDLQDRIKDDVARKQSAAAATSDLFASETTVLQQCYMQVCHSLGVVPRSFILRQVGSHLLSIQEGGLSSLDLRAILTVAVMDKGLQHLDITGNELQWQDSQHITQFLVTSRFLTYLALRDSNLHGDSLGNLIPFICGSKILQTLDLSGNKLRDKDGSHLCRLFQNTECLTEVILHHNELGQCGWALGNAIASNHTVRTLSLSWNHFRGAGAVGIAKGIGANRQLIQVDLSWNGFGYEGCVALGVALKTNTTLKVLDLTNNRIHTPALLHLWQGVCANKTLSSLSLGLNPIPAQVPALMLSQLAKRRYSNLRQLLLEGVVVDSDFKDLLKKIQNKRPFTVHYYGELNQFCSHKKSRVDSNNIYNIDPMRILFFMKEHLRTIDLFLKIDQNGDGLLTREEMKYAFELEGYPVSDKALDQVMKYLDTNRSGEVDLGEFFSGERRMRRDQTKEKQEALERLQKLQQEKTTNPLTSNAQLIQTVNPSYSQSFKKPPTRFLPKINK